MAIWNKSLEDEEYFEERTKDNKIIRVAITRPGRARLDCLRLAIRCTDELARLKGFDEKAWLESERKKREEEAQAAAKADAEAEFQAWLREAGESSSSEERIPVPSSPSEKVTCKVDHAGSVSNPPSGNVKLVAEATCDDSAVVAQGVSNSLHGSYQQHLFRRTKPCFVHQERSTASFYWGKRARAGPSLAVAA